MAKLPVVLAGLANLVAAAAAAQPVAQADFHFYDGNRLWEACGQTASGAAPAACHNYVIGVLDTMADNHLLRPAICLPQRFVSGQITDVVRLYLAEHPERRHYTGASIVGAALMGAFPCGAKR